MSGVFYKMLPKYMAWFYLQKVQINWGQKEHVTLVWWFVRVPHVVTTSISVSWEIHQASMICTPNMSSQMC